MRKLSLFIATCTALVAFMTLGAPAFASPDQDCDGTPYNNNFEVHDLVIQTTTMLEHAVSGLTGRGLVCGSDINAWTGGGSGTLARIADVVSPPGVEVNSTGGMQTNSYSGSASVRVRAALITAPSFDPVLASIRIRPVSECQLEENGLPAAARHDTGTGPNQKTIVACYKARTLPGQLTAGQNWNWALRHNTTGRYTLVIGKFNSDLGATAGIVKINEFTLCANAGAVGTEGQTGTCGDSSRPWLQKNGDVAEPNCNNGAGPNGLYRVSVVNMDGVRTPDTPGSRTCVPWEPEVDPDCDGDPYNNTLAINRFTVQTNPTTPSAASSLGLDGVVCGTDPASSVTDHVDFRLSLGEVIYNNAMIGGNLPTGAYAGSLGGRLAYGNVIENIGTATVRVDELDLRQLNSSFAQPADSCNQEAENGLVGNNPGTDGSWSPGEIPSVIFTCFEVTGQTVSGTSFSASLWRTLSGGSTGSASDSDFGRNYLTLGPIHIQGQPSTEAGITKMSLDLCANAGTSSCGGASDPVVHQNGPSSACPNGVGRYEAVATRKDGQRTADFSTPGVATSCVNWQGARGGERSSKPGSKLPPEGLSKLPSDGETLTRGTSLSSGSKGISRHSGTRTRGY